jgi:hypothetical protein
VRYLRPEALQSILNWSEIKEESRHYKSLVILTLKSMNTFIKLKAPDVTHNTRYFQWPKTHELVKQERIKTSEEVFRALTALSLKRQRPLTALAKPPGCNSLLASARASAGTPEISNRVNVLIP